MRIISLKDPSQLTPVVQYKVWGRARNQFSNWQIDEKIIFLTRKSLIIMGTVSGEPFCSNLMIWEKDLFPWRVPLSNLMECSSEEAILAEDGIRNLVMQAYGKSYGNVFHLQLPIAEDTAFRIVKILSSLVWKML